MGSGFPRKRCPNVRDWGQVCLFQGKSGRDFRAFTTSLMEVKRIGFSDPFPSDVLMCLLSRFHVSRQQKNISHAPPLRETSIHSDILLGIVWGRARAGFLPRRWLDRTKPMPYASIRAGKRTPRVRFSPGACAPGIRSYQLLLPATCLMVTWRRLKRLAVAIMRIKTASPCSS